MCSTIININCKHDGTLHLYLFIVATSYKSRKLACNYRWQDSVIESQTLRLKPYQTVTIRNKNVSHIAGTDDMLSSVTKVIHIKKEEVRGCINHKHIYNCCYKCRTAFSIDFWFYISQNCQYVMIQKSSHCLPLPMMSLTRLTPRMKRRVRLNHVMWILLQKYIHLSPCWPWLTLQLWDISITGWHDGHKYFLKEHGHDFGQILISLILLFTML